MVYVTIIPILNCVTLTVVIVVWMRSMTIIVQNVFVLKTIPDTLLDHSKQIFLRLHQRLTQQTWAVWMLWLEMTIVMTKTTTVFVNMIMEIAVCRLLRWLTVVYVFAMRLELFLNKVWIKMSFFSHFFLVLNSLHSRIVRFAKSSDDFRKFLGPIFIWFWFWFSWIVGQI